MSEISAQDVLDFLRQHPVVRDIRFGWLNEVVLDADGLILHGGDTGVARAFYALPLKVQNKIARKHFRERWFT